MTASLHLCAPLEDYVKRAKDFHKKEDIIKGLQRKAARRLTVWCRISVWAGRHISKMKTSSPMA